MPELARRFFSLSKAELYNLYGPTEVTIDATLFPCRRDDGSRNVPIGRPTGNTEVYILDPWLQPVPMGVKGELYLGGSRLARGYCHRPALTAERFVPNPFDGGAGSRLYRTGDHARWLPDGNVEFLGRSDNQVKLRGHRIELGEIESALSAHAAVRQAVVVVRAGAGGMPTLVAYVVMRPGQVVSSSALRDHLQQSLPEPMVPAVYVVLDEFPRTSSGKLDREALPAPEEQYAAREEYMAPRTETERQIAGVWKDVLEVDRVGVHDNFFELGGHSMIATVLVSRLRDLFSVEVSVRQFFEGPTVAELADRVDATQWATESLQGATSACAAANREEGTI